MDLFKLTIMGVLDHDPHMMMKSVQKGVWLSTIQFIKFVKKTTDERIDEQSNGRPDFI